MIYKNIKTGNTFDVDADIKGEDWEAVTPSQDPPKSKKAGGNNGSVRNRGRHGKTVETT